MNKILNIPNKTICQRVILILAYLYLITGSPLYAQNNRITLRLQNVPATNILSSIGKQTGLTFWYSSEVELILKKPASINANKVPLKKVLTKLLDPKLLTFDALKGNIINIKEKPEPPKPGMPPPDTAVKHILAGTITDLKGTPLPGAVIMVNGRPSRVIADERGNFNLSDLQENDWLTISRQGYISQQLAAGNSKQLQIALQPAIYDLDETVVSGYHSANRRLSTSNYSIITGKQLSFQPVNNPLLALAGRIPGLFIEQTTGQPGTGVKLQLQGQNSLQRINDPLFIIDGVRYLSRLPYTLSIVQGGSGTNGINIAGVPAGAGSPLDFINPADIVEIIVMKDAAATALYGSQAANGVIIINTRRPNTDSLRLFLTLEHGWATVARSMQLLNTAQYLGMRAAAYRNDGLSIPDHNTLPAQDNLDLTWYDPSRYTNWQRELIGNTALYSNLHAALSGGYQHTWYQLAMGYRRQTTVYARNLGDHKGSLHVNVQHGTDSTKFRLILTGNYMQGKTTLPTADLTKDAMSLAPNAPALYTEDGTLNWAKLPDGTSSWTNPLARLDESYRNTINNLLAGTTLDYTLQKTLHLSTTCSYNWLQLQDALAQPLSAYTPQERSSQVRSLEEATTNNYTWSMEPKLKYFQKFRQGTLAITIGYTWQEQSSYRNAVRGTGFATDEQLKYMTAATHWNSDSTDAWYRFSAIYSAVDVTWRNRYALSLSVRQDHSSRLPKANRSHIFGSAAAAWIFFDESTDQPILPLLGLGKLRATYSITGNDGMEQELPDVNNVLLYRQPQPRWENILKLSLGMDISLLNNWLQASISYYHNRSDNQLLYDADPPAVGFPRGIQSNRALVQNTGIELELRTANITLVKELSWSADANITIPRNKLLAFRELQATPNAGDYVVGQPVNLVRIYAVAGVDPATGLLQVLDKDGKVTPLDVPLDSTDRVVNVNLSPRLFGGMHHHFAYRGWELDVTLQFVQQTGPLYNWGSPPGQFYGTSNVGNQPVAVLKAWQQPSDITSIPRAFNTWTSLTLASYNNGLFSTAVYGSASYTRLKNLSLSYTIHKPGKDHPALKLFIHAQNLLTFTSYKGLDPETKSAVSLPPLKVVTVGCNLII